MTTNGMPASAYSWGETDTSESSLSSPNSQFIKEAGPAERTLSTYTYQRPLCNHSLNKLFVNGHTGGNSSIKTSLTHMRSDSGIGMETNQSIKGNNLQSLSDTAVSEPTDPSTIPSFGDYIKRIADEFESAPTDGRPYGNDRFVGQEVGPSGGVLILKQSENGPTVVLKIDVGALLTKTKIYMGVEWNKNGFSPRVKLGPSGTKFEKPVYLHIPLYRDDGQDLLLSRREDEFSPWVKNPEAVNYSAISDLVVIELFSFSDYEVIPRNSTQCHLRVYIQQSDVGDSLCVRSYLMKRFNQAELQALEERERGLSGKLATKTDVLVQTFAEVYLDLRCEGLQPFEPNTRRVVTDTWLSEREFVATHLLQFTPDFESSSLTVVLSRGMYASIELTIPVERCNREAGLTAAQRAHLNQDRSLYPLDEPPLLFPREMVERLVVQLDKSRTLEVNQLAESMEMPLSGYLSNSRLHRYGGSISRYVLHYIEHYCLQQSYSKNDSIRLLRQKLITVRLEIASDILRDYDDSLGRPEPQEHSEDSTDTDSEGHTENANGVSDTTTDATSTDSLPGGASNSTGNMDEDIFCSGKEVQTPSSDDLRKTCALVSLPSETVESIGDQQQSTTDNITDQNQASSDTHQSYSDPTPETEVLSQASSDLKSDTEDTRQANRDPKKDMSDSDLLSETKDANSESTVVSSASANQTEVQRVHLRPAAKDGRKPKDSGYFSQIAEPSPGTIDSDQGINDPKSETKDSNPETTDLTCDTTDENQENSSCV